MTTNIKEIDEELEALTVILEHQLNHSTVESLIHSAIYEDIEPDFIYPVENTISYVDLGKGYKNEQIVLYLSRIKRYIKIETQQTSDGIQKITFLKEVSCIPYKTVIYR